VVKLQIAILMSPQVALPTLLDPSRHRQEDKLKIQKTSQPQAQAATNRSLKNPQCQEEESILLPHNGIRFLMDELLDAVRNMDPKVNWKWENLGIWYQEYFVSVVQNHQDTLRNIYLPWIQAKVKVPSNLTDDHVMRQVLHEISELIKAGRQANPSQKSRIQTHLCEVVEEMVESMHDHLAEQEEIIPRLIHEAGFTQAEQADVTLKIMQSLDHSSSKVVLPTLVHALKRSAGLEKAAAFEQSLPVQTRFLCTYFWVPDFQTRHQGLIQSVHRNEIKNPAAAFSMLANPNPLQQSKRKHRTTYSFFGSFW
jgi:hypothetical protein